MAELEASWLHVDAVGDVDRYVAGVRALNDAGVEIPWVWRLSVGSAGARAVDRRTLEFGVWNEVGALVWYEADSVQVPVEGTNAEPRRYHLAGLHDTDLPAKAEVPVGTVYRALAEFLRTRTRPTCLRWEPARG